MQPNTPLVSVLMLTYNHESYIAQAIESVLAQKTNFNVELVIGEDCSTDRTYEICKQYQTQYPDIVKLIHNENNIGISKNFVLSYNACNGKYMAICEGDDFWINANKLQIQVDYLESHPDVCISIHRVMNYYPEDNSKSLSNPKQKKETTIADLADMNYISNVSAVFRNKLFDLPEWFSQVSTYDYAMHMINAQFGKIVYLPKVMAVYRQHKKAIWSRTTLDKRLQIAMDVRFDLINYFQHNIDISNKLKIAYANNAMAKIIYCKSVNNFKEMYKTWNSLAEICPDWVIEKLIHEIKLNKRIDKELIKKLMKVATFFRVRLSKLYPLPQLKLSNNKSKHYMQI
jgi:glycosyltransferase involved in cell wall biosynthesis